MSDPAGADAGAGAIQPSGQAPTRNGVVAPAPLDDAVPTPTAKASNTDPAVAATGTELTGPVPAPITTDAHQPNVVVPAPRRAKENGGTDGGPNSAIHEERGNELSHTLSNGIDETELRDAREEAALDEERLRQRERRSARVGGRRLIEFHLPQGGASPEQRARALEHAIRRTVDAGAQDTPQVRISGADLLVVAGEIKFARLTPEDAAAAGNGSIEQLAETLTEDIRTTVNAELARRRVATTIFSASLAALLALASLLLIRKTSDAAAKLRDWVAKHRERIPALRIQSTELIGQATVRSAVTLGVDVAKWTMRIIVGYSWLLLTLLLFDSTRSHAQQLTGFILSPALAFTTRTATALPLFLVVLLAFGVLAMVLRFFDQFFLGISRGESTIAWLPPDLAQPTGVLLKFGASTAFVLFILPVVTGSDDGNLTRVALIALAAVGLATTPLLSSAIVGVLVVFTRRLTPGDYVEFGGETGRVVHVGLLEARLEHSDGSMVRVPQLLALIHRTRIEGRKLRTAVEAHVPQLDANTLAELERVGARLGERARVEIVSLDGPAPRVRVSVVSTHPDARNQLFMTVHEALSRSTSTVERTHPGPRSSPPMTERE